MRPQRGRMQRAAKAKQGERLAGGACLGRAGGPAGGRRPQTLAPVSFGRSVPASSKASEAGNPRRPPRDVLVGQNIIFTMRCGVWQAKPASAGPVARPAAAGRKRRSALEDIFWPPCVLCSFFYNYMLKYFLLITTINRREIYLQCLKTQL